ncbi:MAG TPA: DUF6443 domain-containing protein, partial [Parafilimonas sp.]|nr:DUF6443 domain-containing protein [Parafilimonas sp.]
MNKFRYFLSFVACLSCPFLFSPIQAQKPGSQTQPGAGTESIATKPVAYSPTTPVNSIRVWEATKSFATEADLVSTDNTLDEVKQTTQYFDGLGRPLQTVSKGSSPLGYDNVIPFLYDAYGRETLKYLPYVSSGHSDGTFKLNPFQEQEEFLKTFYNPGNAPGGEAYFYGRTDYEASPLNREIATFAPGNSWVGDAVGVSTGYMTNTGTGAGADNVKIWDIGLANG